MNLLAGDIQTELSSASSQIIAVLKQFRSVFLAAHVLDHRYCGHGLTDDQAQAARQFVHDVNASAAEQLTVYLARNAPFNAFLFGQKIPAECWWDAGKLCGFPLELTNLEKRLHGCHATTLERTFRTMRLTYGLLRTRLGVEKAGKWSFLFRV